MKTVKVDIAKFPELKFKNENVYWDTRQLNETSRGWSLICEDEFSNLEAQKKLRSLKELKTIGTLKSQCDITVGNPRRFLGELASQNFSHISSQMFVMGITGTNGKSTSAQLAASLLSILNGPCACVGTLGIQIFSGGSLIDAFESGFTTPEAPTLHRLFFDLFQNGIRQVVMEVSSHAVKLERIAGVDFDVGIFTNLTQDHLDFHKTMEEYELQKTRFFTEHLGQKNLVIESHSGLLPLQSQKARLAIFNGDDPAGLRMLAKVPLGLKSYSFRHLNNYCISKMSLSGMEIDCEGDILKSPLVGRFNAENIVGIYLALKNIFPSHLSKIKEGLENFKGARGRMEKLAVHKERHIFVDYAHTPDALEKALKTLQNLKDPSQKLWVLFGCGGDRDPLKRPMMGQIAEKFSDHRILSSDNPRTEEPEKIINDILAGMKSDDANRHVEVDRGRAISFAVRTMKSGDILLIAGKGHEEYQIIGKDKIHFSDFEVAELALKSLKD